jgi:hypothetical protein
MNDLSPFDELTHWLDQWERRRFWSEALIWLPRGMLAVLVAAAVIAALSRFRPVFHNREVALITLGMALLGFIISLLALLFRKRSLLDRARFFDSHLRLQERVSTSVEIHAGRLPTLPSLATEQLADATRVAAEVDVQQRIPLRPHWPDLAMILLAGLLLFLAITLPNSFSAVLVEQQAVAESIADQVTALQALEQHIQEESSLADADRQELLAPIESALQELNTGELAREEAVAVLSQTEAELRELSESNDAESLTRALDAAGQSLAQNLATQALSQALADGDLAQASSALNQLADRLAGLSAGESSHLAQDLAQAAAALQGVNPALAGELAEATQALQSGEVEAAQQALREAAAAMQQRAVEQAAAAQAQSAAEQLQTSREQVASAGASVNEAATAEGQSATGESSGQGQGSQGRDGGQGSAQGQGAFTEEGQGAGGPGPGGGHAESVYVPDYADLSAEAGVEIELPAECIANPEDCGALLNERPTEFSDEQSLVPYDQVFGDYRNAAIEALESDYVPLGLKGFVRDYFSLLEP